jgi:pantothenate kinase-related protein Tda10
MTDFSKIELKRKFEEAKKEVEYYKKITEKTGKLCLRETEALSKLLRWRKQAEEALKEREVELEGRNTRLKEVNAALKILLEKRIQDKAEFEENVLTNMKELVLPYV